MYHLTSAIFESAQDEIRVLDLHRICRRWAFRHTFHWIKILEEWWIWAL